MKKRPIRSRSRKSHPRRRKSPPRGIRVVLRPGQRLITDSVIVRARMIGGGGFGATTDVYCECTKADPDMPDCKPKSTPFPGGTRVTCKMSGGCKECKQTTVTTSGTIMF
jgi:hypothetical protein